MDTVTLTPALRRSTAEALKVAREADKSRPGLRTLVLDGDAGYVTDSYRAVRLDWLADLATDERTGFDVDALYDALKGAGKHWARIDRDGDRLTVYRLEAPSHWGEAMAREMFDELDVHGEAAPGFLRGAFVVEQVEGFTIPGIREIMEQAIADVTAEDFVPTPSHVNGEYLASLVKCHAKAFASRAAADQAVQLLTQAQPKPCVLVNGQPYALLMPVRVH